MINFRKLAGKDIETIIPYKPGKPVKELERELGITGCIKLASNENPLGCSHKVIQDVSNVLADMSRYPLDDVFYLRKVISEHFVLSGEMFMFGSGSSELIELTLRTFVSEGENAVSPSPSFPIYGLIAQAMGSEFRWVPVKENFKVDFDALIKALDSNTRVIFLANPNNPTGEYFSSTELESFMNRVPEDVIVVMDEAYVEYADAPDFPDTVEMLSKYPNMFVMRTFSKAFGLAAARIGYMIAEKEALNMMNRVRLTFNVNMLAQVAAVSALKDNTHLKMVVEENKQGKEYLYKEFERIGLRYIPTQANFVLVNVKDGERVFNNLLKEGVIVRFLGKDLSEWIRVSIGTMNENYMFISKLEIVLNGI